ncbi:hypothetical protein LOTGIDRAFT_205062 [Lottia gigantea]|uniref:G-protein coupled receptors family 1 profile domain-containing protein n=1 Tax=Lottia gigantea TaxID=225164 RepID=V4B724_LOTGI|nr:hypothetical protein LOTGIDRAFT_205062 [Lottia gigantea]ESP03341.1 hypothetical protein LOTGIDRAFT_205062 [Lottia gigantea]
MASFQAASVYCVSDLELPTYVPQNHTNYRQIFSIVCLTAAGLGFTGSIVQLITWIISSRRLEDGEERRSLVNPTIVISLAIANIISSVGVVLRSMALLSTKPPKEYCALTESFNMSSICEHDVELSPSVCQKTMIIGNVLEGLTDYSFIVGALLTLSYSADVLHRQRGAIVESQVFKNRPTSLNMILCWILPFLFIAGSTVAVYYKTDFPQRCPHDSRIHIRYLIVYLPITLVMIINPILLFKARSLVKKSITRRTATFSSRERNIIRKMTIRFIFIVLLYIICWIPNIAESCTQVILYYYGTDSPSIQTYQWLFPLLITEAIMNPLQGFYNCFLYGLPGFRPSRCFAKSEDITSSSMEESQSLLSNKTGSLQRHCVIRRILR